MTPGFQEMGRNHAINSLTVPRNEMVMRIINLFNGGGGGLHGHNTNDDIKELDSLFLSSRPLRVTEKRRRK